MCGCASCRVAIPVVGKHFTTLRPEASEPERCWEVEHAGQVNAKERRRTPATSGCPACRSGNDEGPERSQRSGPSSFKLAKMYHAGMRGGCDSRIDSMYSIRSLDGSNISRPSQHAPN